MLNFQDRRVKLMQKTDKASQLQLLLYHCPLLRIDIFFRLSEIRLLSHPSISQKSENQRPSLILIFVGYQHLEEAAYYFECKRMSSMQISRLFLLQLLQICEYTKNKKIILKLKRRILVKVYLRCLRETEWRNLAYSKAGIEYLPRLFEKTSLLALLISKLALPLQYYPQLFTKLQYYCRYQLERKIGVGFIID